MILRRVANALKKQDWVTVLLELVLVVAGVLIALQLDKWNDQQAQRLEEKQYLDQLLVEFVVIRNTLEDQVMSYQGFRDAALELVLVSQGDVDVTTERLSELYEIGTAGRIPSGPPAALRELISAGKMGLISNRQIRTSLMRVDFKADLVTRVFDLLRAALLEQLQDLRVHVRYSTQSIAAGGADTADNTPHRSVNVQSLRQDPRAVASAKSYFESQRNMLQILKSYLVQVEGVIEEIEAELAL